MSDILTKEIDILNEPVSQEKIISRLGNLKDKYQKLVSDLTSTPIDDIFGYANKNYENINSSIFLNKINENIEIQENIVTLRNNIAAKLKNLEKLSSFTNSQKKYDSLKNEISNINNSLNQLNYVPENEDENKQQNIANLDFIVEKIESLKDSFEKKITSLQSNMLVKDEAIYKDEISFLKNEIDKLLLENKECKEKLSELIVLNNEKEHEINHSFGAWTKSNSKLVELENLFVLQKQEYDNLDNEKNELIDALSEKIKNLRNEENIYSEFTQDLMDNKMFHDDRHSSISLDVSNIENIINDKFNDLKAEFSKLFFDQKQNNQLTEVINARDENLQNTQANKLREILTDKTWKIINNVLSQLLTILEQLDVIALKFNEELDLIIKNVVNDKLPPNDIDILMSGLMNIEEYSSANFSEIKNYDEIYEKLKNIKTIKDFQDFILSSKKEIVDLINDNNSLLETSCKKVENITNINKNNPVWVKLEGIIQEINDVLHNIELNIQDKIPFIESLNKNSALEETISGSKYWFKYINVLSDVSRIMNELLESIENINFGDLNNELKQMSGFNLQEEINNELNSIMNDSLLSAEEKNKKLKEILAKFKNIENKINIYKMTEFEEFVNNL